MQSLEEILNSKKWTDKLSEKDIALLEKVVECNHILATQVMIFVGLHDFVSEQFNKNLIIQDETAAMSDDSESGYVSRPTQTSSRDGKLPPL